MEASIKIELPTVGKDNKAADQVKSVFYDAGWLRTMNIKAWEESGKDSKRSALYSIVPGATDRYVVIDMPLDMLIRKLTEMNVILVME